MNREIKFRVWDKLYKRFLSQEEMTETGGFYYNHRLDPPEQFDLMQYTGLLDKNGKEIYEGDVLYKFGIDDAPYEVKYGVQPISHEWLGIGFYTEHLGEMGNIFGGEEVEVIGNRYQNPELLD